MEFAATHQRKKSISKWKIKSNILVRTKVDTAPNGKQPFFFYCEGKQKMDCDMSENRCELGLFYAKPFMKWRHFHCHLGNVLIPTTRSFSNLCNLFLQKNHWEQLVFCHILLCVSVVVRKYLQFTCKILPLPNVAFDTCIILSFPLLVSKRYAENVLKNKFYFIHANLLSFVQFNIIFSFHIFSLLSKWIQN